MEIKCISLSDFFFRDTKERGTHGANNVYHCKLLAEPLVLFFFSCHSKARVKAVLNVYESEWSKAGS